MKKINLIFFHPYSGLGGADRSIARVINNLDQNIFNFHFITISKPNIKLFLKKKVIFHKINSSRTFFSIFKIRKILKNINDYKKKNIFISNQNFANILSFLILFNFKNFKHILIERNSFEEFNFKKSLIDFFKKKIIKLMAKILYKYSDLIICISNDLKKEVKNYTRAKVISIYNPALDRSIYKNKKIKINELKKKKLKKNFILNIGRLEDQKDQITLLKAYVKSGVSKKLDLIIIGYGTKLKKLYDFIKLNKIIKNVKILTNIKNPEYFLMKSKLFVLTSKYEGFGNVLIEAANNKIPIISSDCKHGPKEILGHGKFGELFPLGNSDILAKKIYNFSVDDRKLVKKSKKLFKTLHRFSTNKIIKKYNNIFIKI